jgi:mersacidin/lichenicidin family type 2 lantibiotic
MKKEWIVRAWKDPAFRASLSAEERAALPESPSGKALTELDESALLGIIGGLRVPATGCTDPTCGINVP